MNFIWSMKIAKEKKFKIKEGDYLLYNLQNKPKKCSLRKLKSGYKLKVFCLETVYDESWKEEELEEAIKSGRLRLEIKDE